jgi:hypothetical protein
LKKKRVSGKVSSHLDSHFSLVAFFLSSIFNELESMWLQVSLDLFSFNLHSVVCFKENM